MKLLTFPLLLSLLGALPELIPGHRVQDFADIIPTQIEADLEALAAKVERETTAELAVVTVRSLEGETVERFANDLFNTWGIGRSGVNNGALLLVAPNERRVRIEVGYGLEPLLTDAIVGEIRDTHILPKFRSGDIAGGVRDGVHALAQTLRLGSAEARGIAGSAPAYRTAQSDRWFLVTAFIPLAAVLLFAGILFHYRRRYDTLAFALVLLALVGGSGSAAILTFSSPHRPLPSLIGGAVLGVAALLVNVRAYCRFGATRCDKCTTAMVLLSEAEEDPKLSAAEKIEEELGTVDYDVWICPACLREEKERNIKALSGYRDCPHCSFRLLKEVERVTAPATYTSTGLAEVTRACRYCKFHEMSTRILPMLVSSTVTSSDGGSSGGGFGSSDSGGDFGGGSSGGGGASGDW